MRRAGRFLFTLFAAASFILVLVLLAAWLASPWYRLPAQRRFVGVGVDRGALRVSVYDTRPKVGDRFGVTRVSSIAGVEVQRATGLAPPNNHFELVVPMIHLVAVAAALPAAWGVGLRRRRVRERWLSEGLCVRCGYDLRASGERCPECGAEVKSAPATPARKPGAGA